VYIGQLITPRPGNLTADARVCDYIGKGSRLAQALNLGIRRSFVTGETLTFSNIAPFEATLNYPANGDKNPPVRLYNSITGVELLTESWNFVKVSGQYTKVIISPDSFDQQAVYKIDYQSVSTTIKDPLPVVGLRTIKAIGNQQDRSQYRDFVDFYIPFSFAGPTAGTSNSIMDSFLTGVFADGGNSGSGAVAIDGAASYNHMYNRFYVVECTNVVGTVATFEWSSIPYSGGTDSLPPTPLHTSMSKPSFSCDSTVPSSLVQTLELGIKISFTFGGGFGIGDRFYFNGVGPGLLEFDGRHKNSNQFLYFSSITSILDITSTGSLSYATSNSYTGTYNMKVKMSVTAASGVPGNRLVDFAWAIYGDILGSNGSVTADETGSVVLELTSGIKLTANFGANNFVVGDEFEFSIKAPRVYYQAKDDRVYDLKISSALNPGADYGVVNGSYSTGTVEGGFGSWNAEVNMLTGANQLNGLFSLPDNINIFVRNAMRGSINGTSYAASDEFTASASSEQVIDWSLAAQAEEIKETSSFLTDVTGSITGSPGTTYVIIDHTYTSGSISVVENIYPYNPVSFFEIVGTRFLAFVSTPTTSVKITYKYSGAEPAPGQLYYFSANYIRPTELYNKPTLILSRQEGRTLLAPSEVDNHLYIMNELVFDNNAPGAYYTQVYDSDGDGVIQDTDVREALSAHEKLSRATDLCLLASFGSLSDSLSVNVKLNDPFERKEQMLFIGAPIGTPIGDIDTPDSLVFLSQRTLQVTPQSPAQGTRVLVAPTTARKTITLENGVTQQVVLDGSFVAGAVSALVNSFTDPGATILRQNIAGFDTLQVYTEAQNLMLGQASIVYFTDRGSSVYRIEEDVTVHTLAEEFQLISATTQKQFVTRVVRREMDSALISVVVPSSQAAISIIRSTLAGILLGLVGRGLVGDYQDAKGNARTFDPDTDILVFRDTASLTKYDFIYTYFLRVPIKRLFGLYAVNTADLTNLLG
jgi:hypothetical protein